MVRTVYSVLKSGRKSQFNVLHCGRKIFKKITFVVCRRETVQSATQKCAGIIVNLLLKSDIKISLVAPHHGGEAAGIDSERRNHVIVIVGRLV